MKWKLTVLRDLLLTKTVIRSLGPQSFNLEVFIHWNHFDYELILMKPLLMKARFCETHCLVICYLILSPQGPHEVHNIFKELNEMLQIECLIITWDSNHEIKRCLLLGRKAMTNPDNVLKSRNITLPTKVRIVKAMVSLLVMYRCESWIIKKAEHWRMDVFELWCWRRLLRVPWTARISNQSILKELNTEYSLEGLMLKLQYFQLTGKDPDAGKDWRQENETTKDEMVGWHHWLSGHEFEQAAGDGEGQGSPACCVHGVVKRWTRLSDWTT